MPYHPLLTTKYQRRISLPEKEKGRKEEKIKACEIDCSMQCAEQVDTMTHSAEGDCGREQMQELGQIGKNVVTGDAVVIDKRRR